MTARTIELKSDERIVAVVPERVGGKTWDKQVFQVYIGSQNGSLRMESIQRHDWTSAMRLLADIGEKMCAELRMAVPKRKKRK